MRTASISLLAFLATVGAALPAQAAFTRAPWINDAAIDTVTVAWEAATAGGTQQVQYGVGTALDHTATGTLVSGSFYVAKITGLTASTKYAYKVTSGADTASATFVTAPDHAEPFRFVVYGDNRTDATAHASVINAIVPTAPDFIVNTGDLSDTGNYNEFVSIENPLIKDTPLFAVPGNHDTSGAQWAYGFNRANPAWYSYKWANAYFIALSTDDSYAAGSAQLTWLEQQLQAAKADSSVQWIFVYHHYPVYSSSTHGSTADQQSTLVPLYKQYGVDIVFNGHDHDYERSEDSNIVYIVAGGGGAPLYPAGTGATGHVISDSVNSYVTIDLDGGKLDLKAWDTAGNKIDERTFDKGPATGGSTPTPEPTGSGTPGGNPGNGNGDNGTVHGSAMCDVAGLDGSGLAGVVAAIGGGLSALALRRRRA